ncbi:MAG: hypothetical protein QXJ77_03220, partial [Candidatus Bathyarchaeia archaeon]
SDIVIDLKPALKTLQSVSKQLFDVLPEVSSELSEINDVIGETIYSTRISADEVVIPVDRVTPAGEQILKEVSSFLEKKLAEKLPEPPAMHEEMPVPKLEAKPEPAQAQIKQMVALAASCSQSIGGETVEAEGGSSQNLISFRKAEIQEISLRVGKPTLEDALLEYVRKSGGEIDLTRCSRELGASYEDVERALQSLGAKGKIKIEAKR